MKRTYQPSKLKRRRTHGFRSTSATVLASRRRKGRHVLASKVEFKGTRV